MTTPTEDIRERLEAALKDVERMEGHSVLVLTTDLRALLAQPTVGREEVRRIVATAISDESYLTKDGKSKLDVATDALLSLLAPSGAPSLRDRAVAAANALAERGVDPMAVAVELGNAAPSGAPSDHSGDANEKVSGAPGSGWADIREAHDRLISGAPGGWRGDLKRVTDHLETWARDHADECTADIDAAIFCARQRLAAPEPVEEGR